MPGKPKATTMVEQKNQWTRLPFYIVLLFMLSALALYAYQGTFTRYMADDYCSAAALKEEGFLGAQAHWWTNWSGRYSFSFAISLVELLGLTVVPVLPAAILFLWLFSIVWGCLPLLKRLDISSPVSGAIFLASVAVWLTYRSVDDYPQIVFWQTGILTYPVSLILFFLGLGLALRRASDPAGMRWWELLGWFAFALIAGGFSETGVVIQIALLALLLTIVILIKFGNRRILIPILLAALCGSIVSLLVIALAPGNLVRSGGFQDIPPFVQSLAGSLVETLRFIPGLVEQHTTVFVFGLAAGVFFANFFIGEGSQPSRSAIFVWFAASLAVVLIGVWAGIAPAYLLRGGLPPERVLLFAYFLASCLAICWGALGALLLRSILPRASREIQRWTSLGLLVVFIVLGVLPFAVSQVELIAPLRSYSSLWDDRHQALVQASQQGEAVVVTTDLTKVKALSELNTRLWLTGDFETTPENWINRCASQYYGLDQIAVK